MAATKTRQNGRPHSAKVGKLKLCGAPKPNGEPCRATAGRGTKHSGKGRCHTHEDGAAIDPKGNGGRMLGTSADVSPTEAITGVLQLAAGNLAYVSTRVLSIEEDELFDEEGKRWIAWQERLMDKVGKYAATAVQMGVSERQVAIAEEQTRLIGMIIEGVVKELGLNAEQRKAVGPALRKTIATLQTTPDA